MNTFLGIPIDEGLLFNYVISSCICVGALLFLHIAAVVMWRLDITTKNVEDELKKQRGSAEKLREQPQTAYTEKRLARLDKKMRRTEKRQRKDVRLLIGVEAVLTVLLILCVVFFTVPVCTDYQNKDFRVYTGSFCSVLQKKGSQIHLENGIVLNSDRFCDEGKYVGTVVYAHRSNIAVAVIPD